MKKKSLLAAIIMMMLFIVPTFAGNDAPKEKAKPDTPLSIVKTQDLSTYELQIDSIRAEVYVVESLSDKGYTAFTIEKQYSNADKTSSPYTAEKPNGEKVGGIIIHNYVSLPSEQANNIKSKAPTLSLSELTADKTVLSVDIDN